MPLTRFASWVIPPFRKSWNCFVHQMKQTESVPRKYCGIWKLQGLPTIYWKHWEMKLFMAATR
ncbi:hypothetical protein CCAX7_60230 [Capsulimonas corticalis]|uniref:Uncharacterized protein n=1 Tax=Capsulimonas corticalis TaxID=2219043 RepID=A0A402CVY0_9BACT|nr:hypothetical protein CCAX7_60230 [Capsulimonas corticalis]